MGSLRIDFYCRKGKVTKDGTAKVEMSINYEGVRKFITLPRRCTPTAFKKDKDVKAYLSSVEANVWNVLTEMTKRNIILTTESICDIYQNGFPQEKVYTVENLFEEYWQVLTLKDKAGKLSLDNWMKYTRARDAFYLSVDKTRAVDSLTSADIEKYKMECIARGLKETTVGSQYLAKVKTVVLYGMANGVIKRNPFYGVTIKKNTIETIKYLTETEVKQIEKKDLSCMPRLDKVRDMFLFMCYTGLSYTDLKGFKSSDINYTEKGDMFIKKQRNKTNITYTILLLPKALEILKKYDGTLPVISNQKLNGALHLLEEPCKISKSLHCHIARHTYATMLLNRGVSLEAVSKSLGHSNTKMTQHYAKLLDSTVLNSIKDKMC